MIDAITIEVVREALSSVVREMRVNLVRTSYSSVLYEGEDFSCVLMDAQGELVAMSKGQDHPIHIFPVIWSVRAIREKFGAEISPGDMFLHNDPYTGGTHLNDIALISPFFADGELLLFVVVRAHWGDVGGMTPGSLSGAAREIYQEGIRIPPIKVRVRGSLNAAVLELLFANMRIPKERDGDFRAMVGTCEKAAERIEELLGRYGTRTVRACMSELLDRAERRMRHKIRELPEGKYHYEAYLEGGLDKLDPLIVRVVLTIAGDSVTVDLTGSAPQTKGPTNVGPAVSRTAAFTIVKSFLDPDGEINSGAIRPLTVIAPEGTLVNALLPSPCGGMTEVKYCIESAVMGAIAQALGGKVTGDLKGGANHCYIGGTDAAKGPFVFYEYPAGGTGGFDGGDGNSAMRTFVENDVTSVQPVETVEQKYPLRIEGLQLRMDSGGAGKWRGGLGLRRVIRLLTGETQWSVLSDKNILPPYGVYGGMSGAPNRFYIVRNGQIVMPPGLPGKFSGFLLEAEDCVVVETAGGGGFGDPLDRDPALVAQDVEEGLISRVKAEGMYGVLFDDSIVQQEATKQQRQSLRRTRPSISLRSSERLDTLGDRAVCRLTTNAARRLGLKDGDIVELVSRRGAPLRAWVEVSHEESEAEGQVSQHSMNVLSIPNGEVIEIRPVFTTAQGLS